mgnify:CR=1 FL=1
MRRAQFFKKKYLTKIIFLFGLTFLSIVVIFSALIISLMVEGTPVDLYIFISYFIKDVVIIYLVFIILLIYLDY